MKKLFLTTIIALMFLVGNIRAQITLEFENDTLTFGGSFHCIDIAKNESKYFSINRNTNSFSLYNMDFSPFITDIMLPATDSFNNSFVVMYVTRSLFDCDSSNIEYAYGAPLGTSTPFYVLRTDGTVLLKVDSARGPYGFGAGTGGSIDIRPLKNTSDGTKLFLDKLNPWGRGILVYSLCGTFYTDNFDFPEPESYMKLYPNPSDMLITFERAMPNNRESFKLIVSDGYGSEIKRETIKILNDKYVMDVRNLNNGMYYYSLVAGEKVYQSGKFTITK